MIIEEVSKPTPYSSPARILYNIRDTETGKVFVGYSASNAERNRINSQNQSDQLIFLPDREIQFAILGSYEPNSREFVPGSLTSDTAASTNGNQRLAQELIEDRNYYTQITGNRLPQTTNFEEVGISGTGDPLVARNSPNGGTLTAIVDEPQVRKAKYKLSSIRYPEELQPVQDRITFNVKKIPNREIGFSNGIEEYVEAPGADPKTVHIGIQAPILNQNLTGWNDGKMNTALLAGADVASSLMNGDGGKFKSQLDGMVGEIANEGENIKAILASLAVGLNPDELLARTTRSVFNPNLELLFQGPVLRPFQFSFTFNSRRRKESELIKQIIKFFKQNMVPRVDSEVGLFLKAPYVFTIQYKNGNPKSQSDNHESINLISGAHNKKACALIDCRVNYTPQNTYMTFDDKESSMIQYKLDLQFKEIEPIYSSDYETGPGKDHLIGY